MLISLEFKPKVYKNRYICPTCGVSPCFAHCNHCGKDIKWFDEQGDARYETNKNGKRVRTLFNPDGSVHKCMLGGTKDGRFYDVNGNRVKEWYTLKADIGTPNEGREYWFYPLLPEEEKQWKVEIRKYNYKQQHFMCMICAREYNQEVYPRCPSCFKKICRKCGNQQSYIFRSADDLNKCYKCGHDRLDSQQVYYSYMRLYGE